MKPQFNLPYTLDERVYTLTNNDIHSHIVEKVYATLERNGLNDRLIQTVTYDLTKDDALSERTCRRQGVSEDELFEDRESAANAWLKRNNVSDATLKNIIKK